MLQNEEDSSDLILNSAATISQEGSQITKEIIAEQERIDPSGTTILIVL